jgi:ATP-dependent DNA helicase PIF1
MCAVKVGDRDVVFYNIPSIARKTFKPNMKRCAVAQSLDKIKRQQPPQKRKRGEKSPITVPPDHQQQSPSVDEGEIGASLPSPVIVVDADNCIEDPQESRMRMLIESLSPSQLSVFDKVQTGESLFFTGEAGTGKSFLLDVIVKHARTCSDKCVFVTASTGVSACAIGGTTLHSFAGVGLADDSWEMLVKKLKEAKTAPLRKAANRWRMARMLVIDECSMIDPSFFVKLDRIARSLKNSPDVPFGGIQIVMTGDFFQLPPIPKKIVMNISPNTQQQDKSLVQQQQQQQQQQHQDNCTMIFETESWKCTIGQKVYVLMEAHRQKDDKFLNVLRSLRHGCISKSDLDAVFQRSTEPSPPGTIKLYATRKEAEAVNEYELSTLPGEERVFDSKDGGEPYAISANKDHWMAPQHLILKEGALVMFIKNVDVEKGICNGTTGTVLDFAVGSGLPRIRTVNGMLITATKHVWEIKMGDVVIASRNQIPLMLAYAITIHKSQGMTLGSVEVNTDKIFERSQLYVALSRCTSLEGLYVRGKMPERGLLSPHPVVMTWWSRIIRDLKEQY